MDYRPEVDGLRALAVLPVIFFHAGFRTFSGGFVGVDIFFVISGYLITSIILSEKQAGTFTLINFYERRARRILPALFVVMFACLPFAWLWLQPQDMKNFSESLIAVPSFASNVLFWQTSGYFETATELKPLLHTWSLGVEEQYYLFFPIFLMVTWRLGTRWILAMLSIVGVISLAIAQWGSVAQPEATFYLLPTRGWELLIGATAAFYFSSAPKPSLSKTTSQTGSAIGMMLLVYGIFVFDKQTPFPSLYTLIPAIGTLLIILCATHQTLVGKFLGNKVFSGVGLISYSAYLWHQPLFAFARHRSLEEPGKFFFAALVVASIVLAYLSWKYVETPFRNKQGFTRRKIFIYGAIGSFLFVAIGVGGVISNGYESRLPQNALEILKTSTDVSKDSGNIRKDKILGDFSHVKGVLIGDSHAESIAQALGDGLAKNNLGLRDLTKDGCPPMRGLFRFDMPSYGASCDKYYSAVYRDIVSDKSTEIIVISARFTLYLETDRFDNGEGGIEYGKTKQVIYDGVEYKEGQLRDLTKRKAYLAKRIVDDINYLVNSGKKVILLYPIPEVGWDTPSMGIKRALISAAKVNLSTSYARFNERNRFAISVLDSIGDHDNLVRVYPSKILCDTFVRDRCIAIKDSQSLYRDSNHLSNMGAHLVVDEIERRVAN